MLPARYLELTMFVFYCLRSDNWCVVVDAGYLRMILASIRNNFIYGF